MAKNSSQDNALESCASRMLELFSFAKDDELIIIHEPLYRDVALKLKEKASDLNVSTKLFPIKDTQKDTLEKIRGKYSDAKNLILLTKTSLTHHEYTRHAESKGAKVLSVVNLAKGTMQRAGLFDYGLLEKINAVIWRMLDNTSNVLIENGEMKFCLRKEKRMVYQDMSKIRAGGHLNFPIGEVFVAPIENSGNGIIKFDRLSMPLDEKIVFLDNVVFEVKNGLIIKELSENAKKAAAYLRRFENWNLLAELGIGTNPWTVFDSTISESEKCLGTVHIAFGDNKSFGGVTESPIHKDGVIRNPTVFFDSEKIIENGEILVEEIRQLL